MAYSKKKALERGFKHITIELKTAKLNGDYPNIEIFKKKIEKIIKEHPELHK